MQAFICSPLTRWITAAVFFSASGLVFAESPELDITITLMQPGETPEGFINRIELPLVADMDESATAAEQEDLLNTVTTDLDVLTTEVQQTINTTVTDAISAGDLTTLPDSVKDVLVDDLSVELPDELIDQLVDDLIDTDVSVTNSTDIDLLTSELINEKSAIEESAIEAAILEQSLGEGIDSEVLDELLRQTQSNDLESIDHELPVDVMDPLQEEGAALPDIDVINGL